MKIYSSLTLIFVFSYVCGFSIAQQRIVGGQISPIQDSPYVVSLNNQGVYYCAGTLLSYQHVITAAKCVIGVPVNQILVKAGRTNLNENGRQSRRVIQTYYPQAYNDQTRTMDIGGMKLQIPFNPTPAVGLAQPCNTVMSPGTQLQVSGWGSLNAQSTTNVPNLHTVQVPVVNWQQCANQYATNSINITRTSLCAGNGNGDACSLDTGGPGIVNGQLCAVVSFGIGCNNPLFPGVYTNLNNQRVKNFVNNILNK